MERYGYFTLRLRLTDTDADSAASGVVEDLTTGEKHTFTDGQELLSFLGAQSGSSKMRPGGAPGNQEGR
jgi:hypothetical protein